MPTIEHINVNGVTYDIGSSGISNLNINGITYAIGDGGISHINVNGITYDLVIPQQIVYNADVDLTPMGSPVQASVGYEDSDYGMTVGKTYSIEYENNLIGQAVAEDVGDGVVEIGLTLSSGEVRQFGASSEGGSPYLWYFHIRPNTISGLKHIKITQLD